MDFPDNDWAQWRGEMTATVRSHDARLNDVHNVLIARLDRQETNFNARMDKQDSAIEAVFKQAKLSNSRITTLETDHRVDVKVEEEEHRRTESWRWKIGVGAIFGGAVGATIIAELLRLVLGG